MPLQIGETFAGYRVLRLLGSGGMGEVYLVQHPRLPRQEALKVLRPDVSSDHSFRERFIREADLAAGLRHPHIVGIHDRGEHDGKLWIAMDHIDGTDLAHRMVHRYPAGMPRDLVVGVVAAVASALDYAHKKSLLHRDVKPANIIVTDLDSDDRSVFLADFGIARPIDDTSGITTTNMTVGTVAYAAPEQLMGEVIDARADQYALAATTYHLLTGSQLFPNSNPAVVISRHLTTTPPALGDGRPDLADLDEVLQTALAKNAVDRFPSCSAFARALNDVSPGPRTGTTSATAPTREAPRPFGSVPPSSSPSGQPPTKSVTTGSRRKLVGIASATATFMLIVTIVLALRPWDVQRSSTSENTATVATSVPAPTMTQGSSLPSDPNSVGVDLTGRVVVLDAGHGASADGPLTRQVPNGRGGTKDCQNPGTATNDGFPEHTFTWDVVTLIQDQLNALGATTVLSRADDSGPAPCIDARAIAANAQHPDAIVSIHGDAGPSSGHGFHVNYSSPALNEVQAGPSIALANTMRDALVGSGLSESTYIGSGGLYGRSDLAGLNLAKYPAVLIELGNMRNADDAAQMTSGAGRAAYAASVVKGLSAYLTAAGPTESTTQVASGPTIGDECNDWMKLATDSATGEEMLCFGYPDNLSRGEPTTWFSTTTGPAAGAAERPLVGRTGSTCNAPPYTFGRSSDGYSVWCVGGGARADENPVWAKYRP